ncbi:MAG: DMT family transporter [Pseudomonas sp.]
MPSRSALALAGLLLACLCWAGNALVARAFHDNIPPLSLAFWRWSLALLLLLPFVSVPLWRQRAQLRQGGWRLLAVAALGVASYNSLLYTAAQSTAAINLALVNTCLPLATFLGAGLLLGDWPTRRAWLGMAVAALGLLLVIARGHWSNLVSLSFNAGDLVMLLAVVVWALYTLLLRRWARHLALPPLVLLGALMLLGVPMILPFYLIEYAMRGGFALTPSNLGAIAYTAVFASLVAYLAWNHGVLVLGAAKATLVNYLMPVFTALLGWLLLGEGLQPYHWFGAALIFAGLLLATVPRWRSARAG